MRIRVRRLRIAAEISSISSARDGSMPMSSGLNLQWQSEESYSISSTGGICAISSRISSQWSTMF